MDLTRCENGHFFDKDKYPFCPHCNNNPKLNILKKFEPINKKWFFDSHIGKGAFADVYRLKDANNQNFIAAKVVEFKQMDPSSIARLNNYQKQLSLIMKKLNKCENIVKVFDYHIFFNPDSDDIYLIILMELLTPLGKHFENNKRFSENEVVKLGKDMCSALIFCENNGVVHRDIKPENIFVTDNGNFKLGDFDTAETLDDANRTRTIKGTYSYMAPEVFYEGTYDYSCDIYSLGLVLYRIMNNNFLPFMKSSKISKANSLHLIKSGNTSLPKPEKASKEFSEIILKACSYEKENRYQSAEQLLSELNKIKTFSKNQFNFKTSTNNDFTSNEKTILTTRAVKDKSLNENELSVNTQNSFFDKSQKNKKNILAKILYRMINWILFTCLFSFVPLFSFIVFRSVFGLDVSMKEKCTVEFLYFALSTSIIIIRDLSLDAFWTKDKIIFLLVLSCGLFILIFSTVLFALTTLCDLKILEMSFDNSVIYNYSIVLSGFSFIVGTAVQIWEEI